MKQATFDRAAAAIRDMKREGFEVPALHDEFFSYGVDGRCGGLAAATTQGWERIPNKARITLFQEWARRLDTPNANRAGEVLAALIRIGFPDGPVPDQKATQSDWDGAIHEAHVREVLPRIHRLSEIEQETCVFFRMAAHGAVFLRTNDEMLSWVAEKYMILEMLGAEKNPFAVYLGMTR